MMNLNFLISCLSGILWCIEAQRNGDHIASGSSRPSFCAHDEATCGNGECVKRSSICDGEFDCRDRSDEDDCGHLRQCEPNEFQCDNRHCIQKMWVCDNEDDCGDNSDERDCGTQAPGQLCGPRDFQCHSVNQCIPRSYQCDNQNDCQDGSDEHGCSDPTIVQPPEPQLTGCISKSITISCRSVGVPMPYINWRLNWGPVCDPPRCIQTSENGYGTLVINQLIDRDQGAYTCEAINSRTRLLAVPDAILTVKDCEDERESDSNRFCNHVGTARISPDRQCLCKSYVNGPRCDTCSSHCYYLAQSNPHGCIRCFCMGVTRDCHSSDLYRNQERLSFRGDSAGVTVSDFSERNIIEPVDIDFSLVPNAITVTPRELSASISYWRLPSSFLGNKITAYGGNITFFIKYSGHGSPAQDPLLVLKGNEITLVYRPRSSLDTDVQHTIHVPVYETSFSREDGQPATHEHLLMTLAGLESLLIRQTHCQNTQSSSLGEVAVDIAVDRPTEQSLAYSVEQCRCPEGYIGSSCEDCAPGYTRSGGGLYLGTCTREEEHEITRPPVPTRRPGPDHGFCDAVGSVSPTPDRYLGNCICKEHTTGQRCDQCKAGSFYLQQNNPQGCIPCFCAGVSRHCESSNLYRQENTINDFTNWVRPVRTSEVENFRQLQSPAIGEGQESALKFDAFHEYSNGQPLYISLPDDFLYNRISAYGGKLRLRFTYEADSNIDDQNPCIILRGNDISLYHTTRERTTSGQGVTITVPLYENQFQRYDKYPASREHFIMALANLDDILIKISWKQNMRSFSLSEITLDYASHLHSPHGRASVVEQCRCPEGYIGSSCENCATGYSRTGGGLYLGLCEPCFCNGHSDECDGETGECKNCKHNTSGNQCKVCAHGYSGNAEIGTPYDCQPLAPTGHGNEDHEDHTDHPNTPDPDYLHDLDEAPERGDFPRRVPQSPGNGHHVEGLKRGCADCICHNHSPSGCDEHCRCVECVDNTVGEKCELCNPGYYGDALEGTPYSCQKCPCPDGINCALAAEDHVVCHCPQGYGGFECIECALGFKPDPEHPEQCIRDTLFYDQFKRARKMRKKFMKRKLLKQ